MRASIREARGRDGTCRAAFIPLAVLCLVPLVPACEPARILGVGEGAGGSDSVTRTTDSWFEDGFENVSALDARVSSRWTELKTTIPANSAQFSRERVYGGEQALRFDAVPTERPELVSKAFAEVADGAHTRSRFYAGEHVRLSAWFYLVGHDNLQGLTLFDLESESCWRDEFGENPSPGIRLMLSGGNDYLVVERGKIGFAESSIRQSGARFPRDRWVHVDWIVDLSPDEDGFTSVRLDGQEILSGSGTTLPSAGPMGTAIGLADFRLNEPVHYDRVQAGITANMTAFAVTAYLDDLHLSRW